MCALLVLLVIFNFILVQQEPGDLSKAPCSNFTQAKFFVQHFPLHTFNVLQFCYNLLIFNEFPLFLPLFLKVELLHHIRESSFVSAYQIFPTFSASFSFLKTPGPFRSLEKEAEMWKLADFGVRKRIFAFPQRSCISLGFPLPCAAPGGALRTSTYSWSVTERVEDGKAARLNCQPAIHSSLGFSVSW